MALPEPIAAYCEADQHDAAAVTRCFTPNAVVKAEGRTHRGVAGIQAWKAGGRYTYTVEPNGIEEADGTRGMGRSERRPRFGDGNCPDPEARTPQRRRVTRVSQIASQSDH